MQNIKVKTSYGIAILGACFIISLFFINLASKQFDSIALSIPAGSQTAAVVDFNSNLIAHLKFDEGSGSSARDESGNGNIGTLINNPTWVTSGAPIGNAAIAFNGTNQYVSIPSIGTVPNAITISFWIKNAPSNPSGSIMSWGYKGFRYVYNNLWFTSTGLIPDNAVGTACVNDGAWHHIVLTDANNTASLYCDNQFIVNNSSAPLATAGGNINIGADVSATSNYTGTLDDFRIYNRVFTTGEISQLYALGSGSITPFYTPIVSNGGNGVVTSSPSGIVSSLGPLWYVDNSLTTGLNDGTSWANAWRSFANINWSYVEPGDTVYISGGASQQTYYETLDIGGLGGILHNKISIMPGQDSGYNGNVIIDCQRTRANGIVIGTNNIMLSGNYQRQKHFTVQNCLLTNQDRGNSRGIFAGSSSGVTIEYVYIKDSANGIWNNQGSDFEVRNSLITGTWGDYGIRAWCNDSPNTTVWDSCRIHDNVIMGNIDGSPSIGATGGGPDGIQNSGHSIIYNNTVGTQFGFVTPEQHPDSIQGGGDYVRIYNNTFLNPINACMESEPGNGPWNHYWAFNNVCTFTNLDYLNTQLPIFYVGRGFEIGSNFNLTAVNDVHYLNNLVSNFPVGTGMGMGWKGNLPTVSNFDMLNNLLITRTTPEFHSGCDDCKTSASVGVGGPGRANLNFNINTATLDYNLLYAGPTGVTSVVIEDTKVAAHNIFNILPSFASYSGISASNDYHLTSQDTAARGHGQNLTQYCTTDKAGPALCQDKDGTSRPTSGAWDIGPYQYCTSNCAPVVSIPTISNVTSSSITPTGATINWVTTEVTSQVLYGLTTAYGSETAPTSGTTQTLSNLTPNTLYHYKVRSTNASGTTDGGDYQFTTTSLVDSQAPNISVAASSVNVPVGTRSTPLTITTDETATCTWGTTPFTTNGNTHTTTITNLVDGTNNIAISCRDTAGNTANSTVTITVTPPSLIPIATKFTTTDLMNKDLNSVSNFEISNSFGKISFVNPVSLIHNNGPMDLDANIAITRTSITLNSNNLPELNHPARLTFNNVRISNPSTLAAIKQDNGPCSGCAFISYQNNVLVFTVPHFTDFSILEDDVTPSTNSLTISFLGSGTGSVVGTTTCSTDCVQTVTSGTPLTLTATPNSDSMFSGFSGESCTTSPCAITPTTDMTVIATFTKKVVTPPPSSGGGGYSGSSGGGGGGGGSSSGGGSYQTIITILPVVPLTHITTINPSNTGGPSTYNFGTVILRNGSRGPAVMELQRFLNNTLHLGLVVDGILGPKTIAVIKTWQRTHNLVPDGLVGPKTKARMNGGGL